MDLLCLIQRQKFIECADLRAAVRAEAVVHRHEHARRDRVRDLFRRLRIDRVIPADGDQQRIAALDRRELLLAQLMAKVAAVHKRHSLGAQDMDGVLAAK